MGRKKGKGRSVKRNKNVHSEPEELVNAPHSFVIHKGLPGGHTLELTKDFRRVTEPFTASSLKERKRNTIKDFVSIAGPLHVTHLSIFSRTELGMYLKIMRLPRGPTLTFKIHNFSLARDVVSSLKKQIVVEEAFKHSPLIVLNSFSGEGLQMKLMASMFQNMFPTINLTNVDLNTVRRCVLMNYNPTTKLIDFRHYNIKVAPVGVSKGVKKVVQGKVPNLARCTDITEFFTKSGMMSESEAEDDPSNHVTVAQKLVSRGNVESGKSAIRLTELGPRLTLQLLKIEDGLLDGEVLYHDLVHKSEEEKLEIQKKRELKRKLKEKRKKVQEDNKKAKEMMKEEHKEKSLKGMQKETESDIQMKKLAIESNMESKIVDDDDKEYYKQEVGEEPDQDLFSSRPAGTKRAASSFHFKSKKPRLDTKDRFNSKDRVKKGGFKKGSKNQDDKFMKHGKGQKRKGDKTNSKNRDFRPIGGKIANKKFDKRKQMSKKSHKRR
ncbi:protein Peter pan [Anthonomus grandis grandis]|uniref:protein Peter pan n=1 Tax=Anthonomus grandis grandis TaxID=2921223 RepID=UPI0021658071|nr:protein Peter pan [Anthonomus grandis grandis]